MTLHTHLTNADACPQFVVSKITADGKKQPCNPQGITASHKDPANWMTLTQAMARVADLNTRENTTMYRVGFSITRNSGYFFLDIDKCLIVDPITGKSDWSQLAKELCGRFPGCFIEVSQSGTGLHIIGRYEGEPPAHKNKSAEHNIELYTDDRFVLFGEVNPTGDWNTLATSAFKRIVEQYFHRGDTVGDSEAPSEDSEAPLLSDQEVIKRAVLKARSNKAFGKGADFNDLYTRNVEVLQHAYPARTQGKEFDESEADMALASMLAWAGAKEQQIERIMRESALVRDKWNRPGYLADTIHKVASASSHITFTQPAQSTASDENCQPLVDEMPQEYQGCYFIYDLDRVYSIKHARLLTEKSFHVAYNSPINKKPYARFTEIVALCGHALDSIGFKPELPHGEITEREGDIIINTYKPIKIKMKQGNVEPFLNLLRVNFPDERDQKILLSYMAALVQNPGVKSMWCPVLQGWEGCGKSFLMDFAAHAVGQKYVYRAKGDEFESRFNGPFRRKLILLIEDPMMKEGKLEERLKQLITQKMLSFESKGVDASMGDHCANLIVTLNNFDNFKKQKGSRRYAVFKSVFQTEGDMDKAGLTKEYFTQLVNWRDTEGYQTVSYFLHNYIPDPEFDFSKGCCTAPHTSTTDDAVEDCRSEVEITIQEAVDSGRSGFRGDFISGTMLTRLFQEHSRRGVNLPNNQRSTILKKLGYEMHAHLINGRATRVVMPDNNQPTIYVKIGSAVSQIRSKYSVMEAYEDAQK